MSTRFNTIALVGRPRNSEAVATHEKLYLWLTKQGYHTLIDDRLKNDLLIPAENFHNLLSLGALADLAIVIGGDGNMLGAARVLSRFDISVIGVNRGNLGFLTDIDPDNYEDTLLSVLAGNYLEDPRFLLEAQVHRHGEIKSHNSALNEAVLHPGQVAHMIEFEVYIDDKFAFTQRSDGLIISTPTGSTAYSLSGGGPILSPSIDAISLVPMYPHTLSSRPLVIDARRHIKLVAAPKNAGSLKVSCDSQVALPVSPGDEVHIFRSPSFLKLIHPIDYDYYKTLRTKLGWSSKLF